MSFSYAYSLKSNEVTLTNCDREPVHVPGCIQPFGVLLAMDPDNLRIVQVSDNVTDWFGKTPDRLIGQPIDSIIGELNSHVLRQAVEKGSIGVLPHYMFSIVSQQKKLDALVHIHNGILIIECEDGEMELPMPRERAYTEVSRIAGSLQQAKDLRGFCQKLAQEVRGLTGLDRVMIYKFHEDSSGEVFAEAKREDLHSYFGLHYPSEDIPLPAREIFRKIWVRPLPSVSYLQSEIVPLLHPDTNKPLDMTYCFLRGASVMYTDYLKNMGVAMALTLSIVVEGKLWGLIACHHYAPKIVPWPLRAACELLAQIASLQLKAVEHIEFAEYRQHMDQSAHALIEKMLADGKTLSELLSDAYGLANYLEADGVAVLESGKWKSLGNVPKESEMTALATWLRESLAEAPLGTEILHTYALAEIYPPALNFAAEASGLLAIPISRRFDEMILWFRREVVQTVSWAGDPYSKKLVNGPGGERLMPRASFEIWQEQLRGQSLPWKPIEIEAARRLRLAIMEVVVARTERISRLNRELAISNEELDAFAYVTSHDLREPLRGIYHYAYYLKEQAQARSDQESVEKTESLLRLTKRMDGLIESLLHFSRVGRTALVPETVNMNELVEEAIDVLRASRPTKKPSIAIVNLLPDVQGDAVRLRELWLNLIGNAVKYNDSDAPSVEIGCEKRGGEQVFFVRDNGIGIVPESKEIIFQMFKRLHGKDEYGGGSGAGLPIVQKIVERHLGRLWLESVPGEGSVFYFTIGNQADE